jgi:hypothetical protein
MNLAKCQNIRDDDNFFFSILSCETFWYHMKIGILLILMNGIQYEITKYENINMKYGQ